MQEKEISIDIIIPTFNSAPSIAATVGSIGNQSYVNWKCYLVDDGSSDDTLEIAAGLSEQDHRITLLSRNGGKKGANTCRNLGWRNSTADYIMFVDADDILLNNCLKDRVEALLSFPEADMWIFQTETLDENGSYLSKFPCRDAELEDLISLFIAHKIQWQTMSPIWKKSFLSQIGGWNEDYLRLQDVELNIRALLHKPQLKFFPGESDTQYKLVDLSTSKRQSALYGFNLLLQQYFNPLVHGGALGVKNSQTFRNAFVDMIFSAVYFFQSAECISDSYWPDDFVTTIKSLGMDKEYNTVKAIFAKIVKEKRVLQNNNPQRYENVIWRNKKGALFTIILSASTLKDAKMAISSLSMQNILSSEIFLLLDKQTDYDRIPFDNTLPISFFYTDKIQLGDLIMKATGSYILFFNSAYTLTNDCLYAHHNYLKKHQDICCTGSLGENSYGAISDNKMINKISSSEDIKASLLKGNVFAQGPVVVRKSALLKQLSLLDNDCLKNENFKLLVIFSGYSKIALMPHNLFTRYHNLKNKYRVHSRLLNDTREMHLKYLGIPYTRKDLRNHLKVMSDVFRERKEIDCYISWCNQILETKRIGEIFKENALYDFFAGELRRAIQQYKAGRAISKNSD